MVGGRAEVVWVCCGWKVARLVYMFHSTNVLLTEGEWEGFLGELKLCIYAIG